MKNSKKTHHSSRDGRRIQESVWKKFTSWIESDSTEENETDNAQPVKLALTLVSAILGVVVSLLSEITSAGLSWEVVKRILPFVGILILALIGIFLATKLVFYLKDREKNIKELRHNIIHSYLKGLDNSSLNPKTNK